MKMLSLSIVVLLGLYFGGPGTLREPTFDAITGSIPLIVEPCNGNDVHLADCPSNCPPGQYDVIKDELSGTILHYRFNNSILKCTSVPTSSCKRYSLRKELICVQQLQSGSQPVAGSGIE